MKTKHKIGITVLSTLAPACALGSVLGILTYISTPQTVSLQSFTKRYGTIHNKYLNDISNGIKYKSEDVEEDENVVGTLWVGVKPYALRFWIYDGNEATACFNNGQMHTCCAINGVVAMEDELKELDQNPDLTHKYVVSVNGASYEYRDKEGKLVYATTYNKFGYITYWFKNINGEDNWFEIQYKIDPYKIN